MNRAIIAVDFGGGSGRVVAGIIDGDHLEMKELHRFENIPVKRSGALRWDFSALSREMTIGIAKAVDAGLHIASIGVDTWGVDFGFLNAEGTLVELPITYRDAGVAGAVQRMLPNAEARAERYARAGIQIMDMNSIYRLADIKRERPEVLERAETMLFMPDLFSYFLTRTPNTEYTIATTSELINPNTRTWDFETIDAMGLPRRIFAPIVMPGEIRGMLCEEVRKAVGIDYEVPVIAVASHDTASAVYATEPLCEGTAFLSSGTWSLLGAMLPAPILTEEARVQGFTNEGGVDGRICFLQNITGLWILQRLIREWRDEGLDTDYDMLLGAASRSTYKGLIDVDDAEFHAPESMQKAIADACRAGGYRAPSSQGAYVICLLRSLAQRYARGIEGLNVLLPEPITRLHIIGGGSRNKLLNVLTEQEAGVKVTTGPAEATALGSIMLQARTLGFVHSELNYND